MKATCRICGFEWEASKGLPQCPECKSIDVELDKRVSEDIWTRFRCRNCSHKWEGNASLPNPECPKCASTDVVDEFGYIWISGNLVLDDLI